jgi:hypothetical protein
MATPATPETPRATRPPVVKLTPPKVNPLTATIDEIEAEVGRLRRSIARDYVTVGRLLDGIRERKLYRTRDPSYPTFDAYCHAVHGFSADYARKLMRASLKTETAVSLLVDADHYIPHDAGVPKTEWAMRQQMAADRARDRELRRMAEASVEADLAAARGDEDIDDKQQAEAVLKVARNLIDAMRDYAAQQDVITRRQVMCVETMLRAIERAAEQIEADATPTPTPGPTRWRSLGVASRGHQPRCATVGV